MYKYIQVYKYNFLHITITGGEYYEGVYKMLWEGLRGEPSLDWWGREG